MDECKPLVPGAFILTGVFSRRETAALRAAAHAVGRGLHSSTFQLNLSRI